MSNLRSVGLSNTPLKNIICAKPVSLEEIYLNNTLIDSLPTEYMPQLIVLSAANTKLAKINFPKVNQLTEIYLMGTRIDKLPTMNLGCAKIISVSYTKLTSLDVKPLSQLLELYICGCKITSIDFSSCTKLTKLSANESSLVAVDSDNTRFKFVLM